MKKLVNLSLIILFLLPLSCANKTNITHMSDKGGLMRVNLADTCIKAILNDYINVYSFDGKGIYLVNIKNYDDSVKYFVGMAFNEQDLKVFLKNAPYYFYDVMNQRIVIIDTKLEKFFTPQNYVFDSDTILNKYYDNKGRFREVYFKEFLKVGETVSSKVIHFDPF